MTSADILETKEFTTNMRKLSESVWGDVRRRAEGQAERKEDEIDNLEPDELAEYIKKEYDINVRDEFFGYDDETALLDVPIISWEKKIIPSKTKTRTSVVIFKPPAVLPGPPPINIKSITKKAIGAERISTGIELKPAVLKLKD